MESEELRFVNNLSVLLQCGRPLRTSLENMRDSCHNEQIKDAYDRMVKSVQQDSGDFTAVLAEYPQLCSRASLALIRAARRSNCLGVVLPKLARLVQARVEGELDPRQRFLETWALMVETGFTIEEALTELRHDFSQGPLKDVAEGLRSTAASNKSLADEARRFPEVFDANACDLLLYGEARDLAHALRSITRLI